MITKPNIDDFHCWSILTVRFGIEEATSGLVRGQLVNQVVPVPTIYVASHIP